MRDKCFNCGSDMAERVYTNEQIAIGISMGVPGGENCSDRKWLQMVIKEALDKKDAQLKTPQKQVR